MSSLQRILSCQSFIISISRNSRITSTCTLDLLFDIKSTTDMTVSGRCLNSGTDVIQMIPIDPEYCDQVKGNINVSTIHRHLSIFVHKI